MNRANLEISKDTYSLFVTLSSMNIVIIVWSVAISKFSVSYVSVVVMVNLSYNILSVTL